MSRKVDRSSGGIEKRKAETVTDGEDKQVREKRRRIKERLLARVKQMRGEQEKKMETGKHKIQS